MTGDHLRDDAAVARVRQSTRAMASSYPFYARVCSTWRVSASETVPTAGVHLDQGVVVLTVNPAFIAPLSAEELRGVLHHECLHVVFGHLTYPAADYPDRNALVIAQEVTVNEHIPERLPGTPILLEHYPDLPPNEDTRTRYYRLEGVCAGSPTPLDCHDGWLSVPASELDKLAVGAQVRAAAGQAGPEELGALPATVQTEISRAHGTRPGDRMEDLVGGAPAERDWRKVLHAVVADLLRVPARRIGKPSRRLPELVGIVPGRIMEPDRATVMAVVDTSGSMTARMLADISAELALMDRTADILVVECDTRVQRVYPFDGHLSRVHGRGGTDLRPPFERAFLASHRPDVMVLFTDGFGPAPSRRPPIPVIWCLSPGGVAPAGWGRVLKAGES